MSASSPNPSFARQALELLTERDDELSTTELCEVIGNFEPGSAQVSVTLEWLRDAGVVDQIGHDRWRIIAMAPGVPPVDSVTSAKLGRRIERIVAWARNQTGAKDLLAAIETVGRERWRAPEGVRRALDEAESLAVLIDPTVVRQFDLEEDFALIESVDPDCFEPYCRHKGFVGEKRSTLTELAEEMGLSRERVRARIEKIDATARKRCADRNSNLSSVVLRLQEYIEPCAPADEIQNFGEELGRASETLLAEEYRWPFITYLANRHYRNENGWLGEPEVHEELASAVKGLYKDSFVASAEQVDEVLESSRLSQRWRRRWIDDQAFLRVEGESVLLWGASMNDKAVALLELAGVPMTLEALFDQLGETKSFRGFKNVVQGDDRVLRRGVKHYGLKAWGGEEYTKLTEEMEQEIERQGGEMELEALASKMAEAFGASAASVRMYGAAHPFVLDDQGFITVGSESELPQNVRPIAEARGCFRRGGRWALKKTVDKDVLRGSGSGMPIPFAAALGLSPGNTMDMTTEYGEVNVSWPGHVANLGSISKIARAEGLVEGDAIFLEYDGGTRFDVRVVRRESLENLTGLELLAEECGLGGSDVELEQIADSLGFDSPVGPAVIRSRFRSRRESDLAELVPDALESDDDLLDELFSL